MSVEADVQYELVLDTGVSAGEAGGLDTGLELGAGRQEDCVRLCRILQPSSALAEAGAEWTDMVSRVVGEGAGEVVVGRSRSAHMGWGTPTWSW